MAEAKMVFERVDCSAPHYCSCAPLTDYIDTCRGAWEAAAGDRIRRGVEGGVRNRKLREKGGASLDNGRAERKEKKKEKEKEEVGCGENPLCWLAGVRVFQAAGCSVLPFPLLRPPVFLLQKFSSSFCGTPQTSPPLCFVLHSSLIASCPEAVTSLVLCDVPCPIDVLV
ncbi:hypothetical protein O3P69_006515 [Scylla paramamosain]|uniref:Uncharacterized protein n=1 Tax=Scylla paramamosain TaxID=85552 RepID=A0AAW0U2S8_SCYPA